MAEGGFKFEGFDAAEGAAEDEPLPEEETSFIEPPTGELPVRAAAEEEPNIGQHEAATASELDRRLAQFDVERGNYPRQPNLEFRASKDVGQVGQEVGASHSGEGPHQLSLHSHPPKSRGGLNWHALWV